jgi:hypothetical protein
MSAWLPIIEKRPADYTLLKPVQSSVLKYVGKPGALMDIQTANL